MARRAKSIGGGAGGASISWGWAPNVATPIGNLVMDPSAPAENRKERKASMATSDKKQRKDSVRAIRKLRDAIVTLRHAVDHEDAEMAARKARYSVAQQKRVRQAKRAEYGTHEYFAVPTLNSYPLTKHGVPNRSRVLAAWRYIHQAKNAAKLGDPMIEKAEKRIQRFAKKHFNLKLHADQHATHKARVDDLLKRHGEPATSLDPAIAVIYGSTSISDAIANVRQYLDSTSSSRDHDVLIERAHLQMVLNRLLELYDRYHSVVLE